MSIKLIYSANQLNYIGKNNKLMWNIPEDLKYFKEQTLNSIVVMGRKTWESLPDSVKPLPDRTNIVLSRRGLINGAIVFNSLEDVIDEYEDCDIWIIGGSKLLEEGMKYADEIHLTRVFNYKLGDVLGPFIPMNEFEIIKEYPIKQSGSDRFKIMVYSPLY